MSTPLARKPRDQDHLRQIVASLAEGVMLIELDGTLLWANAAACAMHGVEGVADLGRTINDYRKRFRLRYRNYHKVAPGSYPVDRAIAGEAFHDVIVEVSPEANPEAKWVHRVRSLVVTNAAGEPDYMTLFMVDITDWANAEQRFEKTFHANPAPALIFRLGDLRCIKVNAGFLEMTGYARDEVIDCTLYRLDVLEQADNRELAMERLAAGETIPQMQADIRVRDGSRKLVIVAGQPIEVGDAASMLFTFMDLEPRRKTENALRQSEERFAKAFRMTPVPTLVCTADRLEITEVNEAFAAASGYCAEDLLGRSLDTTGLLDARNVRTQFLGALRKTGSLRNAEYAITRKDGELLDCLVSAETVSIDNVTSFLVALLDITHRKQIELELVGTVEAVMKDASWFSQALIEKLANARHGNAKERRAELADLTTREREVLGLICEGLADKEIAARLELAPSTVRNHVSGVYAKLDVHRRSEAIVWARERGLFVSSGRLAPRKPARRTR